MNPWRLHPSLAGLPIPESALPSSWGPRGSVRGNPWAEGPTPPLVKKRTGPIAVPSDAADAVYQYMVAQAALRHAAILEHVRTGSPTHESMAFEFNVRVQTVGRWVQHARRKIAAGTFRVPSPRSFSPQQMRIPSGTIYFGSGTQQSPGEIEGFARLAERFGGFGVGIEVKKCSGTCMLALDQVAGRGVPLFVDSGAFPEFMCMLRGGDPESCEIGDEEWDRRLEQYLRIAKKHRSLAYLVAPDKIGDQVETLRRLGRKRALKLMSKAAKLGAWILLVAQGGARSRHQFWERARGILVKGGVPRGKVVAAFPMNAKATTPLELTEFFRKVDVGRAHLLGIGPVRVGPALKAIASSGKRPKISFDSNLITSGAVRNPEFLSVIPRVYTYAQDIVRYEVISKAFQKSYRGGGSMENWISNRGWGRDAVPDYTDNFADLEGWLPVEYRELLWTELSRWGRKSQWTEADRKLLMSDPNDWLQVNDRYMDPVVEGWLDEQWARFLGVYFSARVKRDGVVMAWTRRDIRAMQREAPETENVIESILIGELSQAFSRRQRQLFPARKRQVSLFPEGV